MSSAVDEDTARAINSGRETLGALFSSAQTHLQKVFIVFVIGFIGSFYALRIWIWDFLEAVAKAEMESGIATETDIITRTPFEVILLQAKIGMIAGIIVAIPALLYYSRDSLRRRGVQSVVPISRGYAVAFAMTSIALFCVGIVYAYAIFFPYVFDFLATNAVESGVKPSFGITEFTEFVALLTISFGIAAQLPLAMGALSYTEIVPYETFRDKWRHAVIAIFVFGALFSPPDPFTQVMWALPLIALYVFSLGLAKVVANIRRRGAAEGAGTGTEHVKRRVLQFAALLALTAVAVAVFVNQGGGQLLESAVVPAIPEWGRPEGAGGLETLPAEYGVLGELAIGAVVAAGVGFLALVGYTMLVLRGPVYPREGQIRTATDPDDVDFDVLEATDIPEVSASVFQSMEEEQALEIAREAMYDEDREKAQAILDRFDSTQERNADDAADETDDESTGSGSGKGGGGSGGAAAGSGGEEGGSTLKSTAAGMLDPFTEEETTEEDIGGYAYDIAFIFQSLTSKMFRIVGTFMLVMGGVFFWLYQGGLGRIFRRFVDRVPEDVLVQMAEQKGVEEDPTMMSTRALINELDIVIALHPVEVLIFNVKVSVLAAIVAVLPMVLYYAWPAMKERGLAYGDRRVFVVWGGGLLLGFLVGTYLGFFWIAPMIISYLVSDAIANNMVVSYRISSFSWLIIFTTVGIGFLFNIIVTMALFHVGGIVNYRAMLRHWRPVVVGIFAFSAIASPKGILTMLIFAIPIALTYVLGLVVLYLLTAGGRLFGGGGSEPEPEPEPDAGAAAE